MTTQEIPVRKPIRWRRWPLFRFFASVRLAVVLLVVLTGASIAGTLYESTFDAKVARAYIYGAPWFTLWLFLLALNLTCSALSRLPWKRKHIGFLVTHLGIIMMILGAFIGRKWGIEGTMTLFKGEPGRNALVIDERVLKIGEVEPGDAVSGNKVIPLEIINRKPRPDRPWKMGVTPSGYEVSVIDAGPVEIDSTPRELPDGGAAAVHVSLNTAMMGQTLESWLLEGDQDQGTFDMGMATIELKSGVAPKAVDDPKPVTTGTTSVPTAIEIEEGIFAFSKSPEQVGKSLKGGSTGIKVHLENVTAQSSGEIVVEVKGVLTRFHVADILKKDAAIPGTQYQIRIENFWPDFIIREGQPTTASSEPNNPAILATVHGVGEPIAEVNDHMHSQSDPTEESAPPPLAPGTPPPMGSTKGSNKLTVYLAPDGTMSYTLASRKLGTSSGPLEPGKPLPTGWADWKFTVEKVLPHAEAHSQAVAARPGHEDTSTEGVRVRASRGSDTLEEWVPLDWHVNLPAQGKPIRVAYEVRQQPLPISLRLLNFEVERNEGSDSPAGFKSTVEVTNIEGQTATGQCWMNHPISFPDSVFNTFSGLTYKVSQASWNPENPSQSTVQILRDPGWWLKWIGSLCIVSGVFTLFYLRPVRGGKGTNT